MIAQAECSPANTKRYFATVRHDSIHGFPYNYRKDFGSQAMRDLEESIRQQGIIEPLILHKAEAVNGVAAGYIGIAGERRHQAAGSAGLEEVPAIIFDGISRRDAIEIALVENLQRKDVNPIEEATGYRMLKEEAGMKQAEIAERVGRPRSSVANTVRLLYLPEDVQEHLAAGRLTKAHGVALLRFKGCDAIISEIAKKAIQEGAPAGDLEKDLPFFPHLQAKKLIVVWPYWDLQWDELKSKIVEEHRKADKEKLWLDDPAGNVFCLSLTRGQMVNSSIERARERRREEQVEDNQESEDMPETDEERKEREEEEAEEKANKEALAKLTARLEKWLSWYVNPKKGPTRASPIRDIDGAVKAVFSIIDCCPAEYIEELTDEQWHKWFGKNTKRPSEWAEIDQLSLEMPINDICYLVLLGYRNQINDRPFSWVRERLQKVVGLLEGGK